MHSPARRRRQLPRNRIVRSIGLTVLWVVLTSASSDTCASDGLCSLPRVQGSLIAGRGMTFCNLCMDVLREGSVVSVWESHHNPTAYYVVGEIVYAVPNTAVDDLYNAHQVEGRLVLVDRGSIAIFDKAKRVQEAGGAAMVVVDSGECSANFACGVLGSPHQNAFLEQDEWDKWRHMTIPVVLIHRDDGDRIKAAMDLMQVDMPDLGPQYVRRE
ncbi:hypothetical protein H310_07448 [Aphanomyces invadans]|uniref:PA domain-containing protein n=1 Tax=Aphanomyces invadans TaxID=157072 RepID=A0A024U1C0_9STRA|nr:hypothetical protein H310_07448 [Aphanomyces invadans]ETW00005.1 hypothetical protein H310_07448 [Aphanomyces invadans]|eukprot:XP_008871030.1 hypothetical protein H310_07448 [Aphanomyces invadans]